MKTETKKISGCNNIFLSYLPSLDSFELCHYSIFVEFIDLLKVSAD